MISSSLFTVNLIFVVYYPVVFCTSRRVLPHIASHSSNNKFGDQMYVISVIISQGKIW